MADIPNRDELEGKIARLVGKLTREQMRELMDRLGDEPDMSKLPQEFWEVTGLRISTELRPHLADIYLASAQRFMDSYPVGGVDWTLVNETALDWARRYSFELVNGLNENSRARVAHSVNRYTQTIAELQRTLQGNITDYWRGQTMGELEASLATTFGPVRAEMIAITEVTRSAVEGEREMVAELRQAGINFVEEWVSENDNLVCPDCSSRNGKPITDGRYPPLHVRCLLGDTLVLPVGRIAAGSKRWYEGDIVVIDTPENHLTVTPNHPILTRRGWIGAGQLAEGDDVFECRGMQSISTVDADEQDGVATIQEVFGSLGLAGLRVPVAAPDFHGDGAGSNVAVIRPNCQIGNDRQAGSGHPEGEKSLGLGGMGQPALNGGGVGDALLDGVATTTRCIMCGGDLSGAAVGVHPGPFDKLGLGTTTGLDAHVEQAATEGGAANTDLVSQMLFGLTGQVSLGKVVKVRHYDFSGHVYNLQTDSGIIVAAGIILHNCRCSMNHRLLMPGEVAGAEVKPTPLAPKPVPAAPVPRGLTWRPSARNVARLRDIEEKVIERAAKMEGVSVSRFVADVRARLAQDILSPLSIRRSARSSAIIANEGRFKTQFEVGRSGGALNPDLRRKVEETGLGIPDDAPPEQRPIYGYISTDPWLAANYGSIEWQLKDTVKNRTTITLGDSLADFENGSMVGTPLLNPDIEGWGMRPVSYRRDGARRIGYIEAQIQGQVTLEDVERVIVHKQQMKAIDVAQLRAALEAKGLQVEIDDYD